MEPDHTRLVWITMLALADRFGFVSASVPGLASLARISKDKCEEALTTLSSPDSYSRSTAHEGRRIEKVEGGWNLLNYETYRRKLSAEERREYNAMKQREHREKVKQSTMSMTNKQSVHIAEAEAEASTSPTPPQAEGVETMLDYQGTQIAVRMGRHKRLPKHPSPLPFVKYYVEFLNAQGLPARVVKS